ncbi:hypothetical protein ACIOKD_29760 [Streptomyces sp. NPDC087844]|uniref:hypothetical protein n=1 Tax=Streptomyces sp. NPDC087844 TaxID=3365805 RepID=UPI003817C331
MGPWLFSEPMVLRGLAAGAALTAVLGAVVMRRWDASAGRRVADLARGRESDEWRHEERVAELESDLDESRELRTKLEQRLRAKRAELAGLRNEHAALLRRYATAETERATALEGRRLLEIEAAPASEDSVTAAGAKETAPEVADDTAPEAAVPEATTATVQAALAASSAASVLYVKANSVLDRLLGARNAVAVEDEARTDDSSAADAADDDGPTPESSTVGFGDDTAVDAVPEESGSVRADSPMDASIAAEAGAEAGADAAAEAGSAQAGAVANSTTPDDPTSDDPAPDDPGTGGPAPATPPKGGPVKRTSAKGGTRKGSPSPGGPGKGAPRPGGSPKAAAASAAGGAMTGAPAKGDTRQEDEAPGKPEAADGHERTAAATAPRPTRATGTENVRPHAQPAETAQSAATARPRARSGAVGVTSLQSTATRKASRSAPDTAYAPAPESSPGSALARPTPSEVARVQQPPAAETGPSPTSAVALTPAARPARPAGHFTVPTAVAVAPASPVRRPAVEGGFDFFGTQKGAEALEAVQNEDLADVVGQEALALHKAEAESGFKPVGEESRGVGQVIDLTAHDETEQIDLTELRSAVS